MTSELRLRRDVDALCPTPRHRDVPGSLQAAWAHCREQLEGAGWTVEERIFRPRPALRLSDAGHPVSPLAMRWMADLEGVNLLALPAGRRGPQAGDVLLVAHLDTVRCSTGADDNASGVAVTLEVARQLRGRDHRVVIAVVNLEELWHLGARELARTLPRPGLVVCLDAVGFFDDRSLGEAPRWGHPRCLASAARGHRRRRAPHLGHARDHRARGTSRSRGNWPGSGRPRRARRAPWVGDVDMRGKPLRVPRSLLEQLAAAWRSPLQLTPQTADPAQARQWLEEYAAAAVGVEGLVDDAGALRVAGATQPLSAGVGRAGRSPLVGTDDHPWPLELSTHRLGQFSRKPVAITRVAPTMVVEVEADTVFEHGRWRHLTRYRRLRLDLSS